MAQRCLLRGFSSAVALKAALLAAALMAPMAAPSEAYAQTATTQANSTQTGPTIRLPGARPAPQSTEEGIWTISADAEREAGFSAMLERDPALNAYVRSVQCKVAGPYCDDLRLGIFRRPALNATVMPNGYTEVWSGLLLRAQNEAQLAFVMSHEFAHFRGNHSLKQFETVRARQGAMLALSIVIGAAATFDANFIDYAQYADILRTAAYLGQIAALFAFSRDAEREADSIGQELMAQAGYAPDEAAKIWQTVITLQRASDNLETRRADTRGGIFRTHPITGERMADLASGAERLKSAMPSATELGAERHRAAIRPFLNAWLRDEIRRRDYGMTLALLEQLRAGGDAGVIGFFEGEVYRLRRGPGDDVKAISAYQAAIVHTDAPADTWRELGMLLSRNNDAQGAISALSTYLQRAPTATDAALVQRMLDRLIAANPSPV